MSSPSKTKPDDPDTESDDQPISSTSSSLSLLVTPAANRPTNDSLSLSYQTRLKRHPGSNPFSLIQEYATSPPPFFLPALEPLLADEEPSHVYHCLQALYSSTVYNAALSAATSLLVRCVSRFFPSTSKAIDVASVFGPHMSNLYCSLSPPSAVKSHLLPLLLTRGVPGLVDFTLHVLQVYKPS
eukprot:CAMPEP_0182486196 /NCGR_PEP_ID=MMETSP1319-20130603/46622_1 /TAXON_ID=172717 /ORGANISM="Bolidomonas pacifica, Strain RCC208" /LENGTH=183 /DNA_ID=CAMNT_0024688261 /DNA_START=92 /DNA_END=639 /DNA_ORIENTATION=+